MNEFEMVVMIVLIITVGRVLSTRKESRREKKKRLLREEQTPQGASQDEIFALKDRIATLERIATDNRSSRDLDYEIEKLRDK